MCYPLAIYCLRNSADDFQAKNEGKKFRGRNKIPDAFILMTGYFMF